MKPHIVAIGKTLAIAYGLSLVCIYVFGEYGYFLFLIVPFLLGFLPVCLIQGVAINSAKKALILGLKTLGVMILSLLLFAIECIICIAIASPLVILMTLLGSYLAYIRYHREKINMIILLSLSIACVSMDAWPSSKQLIPVVTQVKVNAPIKKVWNNVVAFGEIDDAEDWVFKTGIAYPINARIEGEGVGAIRYCNFTTGPFVEPITIWEPPYHLAFDVIEQPIPMNEWNPFWDIHPPHLDGYFASEKGQFKLMKIDDNITLLEGTTYYQLDLYPQAYWNKWTDFILHRIHYRALNHVKKLSES